MPGEIMFLTAEKRDSFYYKKNRLYFFYDYT